MNSKLLKVFEDGSISSGAFNNVTNEMWKIINIVFGAAAGIMALLFVTAIIVSIAQNSNTADPQLRKQNNKKILWSIIGIAGVLFFWGIVALIVSSVSKSQITISPNALSDISIKFNNVLSRF
ncbi:hypothetical protein RRG58_05485 [Mycoplasmopsis cynos]|nr:hypothetical protein [Mycoplasmopsis felis]WQQ11308.1 hypothetical protein RRG50_02555 [Mycoplasmopsis felis]WQQ11345.1 hypothetical protein RRG50_02750 [Mycoplasmopsis felis]WQQ11447.1 hypothetical protein RRG50_03295 [Mycoplasmopsis felis]WQQ11485.1 hypothetical protein RRG50_03490 [Mycoplasmopsis felis]WQQ11591.1 hypothetical protein RRG50_04095 [Mycoplasmopsis felis]